MSKFVKVQTQLRDLALLKRALDDLKLDYRENERFVHVWSGFAGVVPLVVQTRHVKFGLRQTADGSYEVIGDDMQMAVIRPKVQQIQQRYAYQSVRQATEDAGFELVEEATGRDQVIRLTVRRWA